MASLCHLGAIADRRSEGPAPTEVDNATAVNGVNKTVNVYDGLSRRVEKRTYNSGTLVATTRYLYDGTVPMAPPP